MGERRGEEGEREGERVRREGGRERSDVMGEEVDEREGATGEAASPSPLCHVFVCGGLLKH